MDRLRPEVTGRPRYSSRPQTYREFRSARLTPFRLIPMYRAISGEKGVTRTGPAEARDIRPDGRGELPVGRRRARRGPRRGRGGDHAGGRAGRPQRRRGQRVGLPCRGPLGGAPVPGTRLLVLAVAYPAAQPDEGPRGRGRGLPVAIGDPGIRDPASGATGAGQYPHAAPAESAFPGASGAAARRVGQRAAAVALRPVTASPPPLTAALAGFVVLKAVGDPLAT